MTVTVLVLVQCYELASINDVLTIITNNNTNNEPIYILDAPPV